MTHAREGSLAMSSHTFIDPAINDLDVQSLLPSTSALFHHLMVA